MISTKISIYILSFNKKLLAYEILSTDQTILIPPSQEIIPNKNIDKNLFDLVSKYIEVENDVFGYSFLDIDISENLNIIYFVTIPYNFPKKNCYFIPVNNTSNEFYIKNIQKILNRI
jgi:hypothetical protein